jgi:hypothetical protein
MSRKKLLRGVKTENLGYKKRKTGGKKERIYTDNLKKNNELSLIISKKN